jgi:hypothetical protein
VYETVLLFTLLLNVEFNESEFATEKNVFLGVHEVRSGRDRKRDEERETNKGVVTDSI